MMTADTHDALQGALHEILKMVTNVRWEIGEICDQHPLALWELARIEQTIENLSAAIRHDSLAPNGIRSWLASKL